MNAAKKEHLKRMPVTALKIPLFLCSILTLLAGSGSSMLAAQPAAASQPAAAKPIHETRYIDKRNGSAVNLNPLPPEKRRTQGLAVETAAEPLTCNGSPVAFESGIPSDWSAVVWTGSVYWSTTDNLSACDNGGNQTQGSGYAACADSDVTNQAASPYDAELFSNSFDLTGMAESKLQFAAFYNDFDTSDKFEVWVWDNGAGTLALQWDTDHDEIKEIDLASYIGKSNVSVSFRYYGPGWDWFAQVDDVSLTCVTSAPAVSVDPLFIGSTQESDSVTYHILDISNVGTATLDWSVEEDSALAADICETAADIPWTSVNPDNGTTTPNNTDSLDVTFDSTGLAPGTYDGVLCINSNDPDPGPGNNTELVIVQLELVVEAAPEPDIFVDPLFIGSTQESDSVTSHTLDISNVGTADLDWSVEEYSALAADICDTPADIPWVSVKQGSGTTTPSNTDVLDVTFDSTGLAPGTYDGVLCINSNDPDPGPGNHTELVIVQLELVVEAAPEPDIDIYLPVIQKKSD